METIIALAVDEDITIKILAINISDPSIVLEKEFIIKKETNTETTVVLKLEQPIVFDLDVDEVVQIDISSLDVPVNWLQYYSWNSSDSCIKVDKFGRVTVSNNISKGSYEITGNYTLNSRFNVVIEIQIV